MAQTKNLGRVAVAPKGAYNSATAYEKLDVVSYGGSSWMALQNVTGVTPSAGQYWMQMASKGDTGSKGDPGDSVSVDGVSASNNNIDLSAVRYVEQSLTAPQKVQARTNIGALGPSDIDYQLSDVSENPVQNKVVKAAVDEVKDAVTDIAAPEVIVTQIAAKVAGTEDVPTGFTVVPGQYIRSMGGTSPGSLTGNDSSKHNTFYMQATSDMDVYVRIHVGASQQICIYHDQPYGTSYRSTAVFSSNNADYPMPTVENPVHVVAGQYITFSYYNGQNLSNSYWELYQVTQGDYQLKSTTPLTTTMDAEVDAKIKAETDSLNADDGYQTLGGTWARGDWDGWNSHTSRAFRVRRTTAISFDRDVILLSKVGYMFGGYTSGGSIGDWRNIYKLSANTALKLNVRRIVETEGENPDADPNEFAVQVVSATVVSPINLYKPTYTDVSMFERMGVGGDSYAGGGGIISGIRSLTWGKNLERQAGITVDIYAKSGTNVVQWSKSDSYGLLALLAGEECGLYWLQHGINGTSTPEELGTAADMSADPQPDTFYGRFTYSVQQIQTTFPNARIILATITGSAFGLSQTTYADVNTAIRAIAAYCEVPCVEITDDAFFRSTFYSSYIRSNHPTAMQCAGEAMAYRRLISKCIQDNPEYFVRYGAD